jgi:hypothetical protein
MFTRNHTEAKSMNVLEQINESQWLRWEAHGYGRHMNMGGTWIWEAHIYSYRSNLFHTYVNYKYRSICAQISPRILFP